MIVLKFKIYSVEVDDKGLTNDQIYEKAKKQFAKNKKVTIEETPLHLLPNTELVAEFVLKQQQEEIIKHISHTVNRRTLN